MRIKSIYIIICYIFAYSNIVGQEIKVTPININTGNDEYAPMYYKEGLYITSNRKNSMFENYLEKDSQGNTSYLTDIYNLTYNRDSSKFKIESNLNNINSPNLHEGPCSFTSSYDTIFFAKTVTEKHNKSKIGIFMSVNESGIWQEPLPLNINNSKYNFSHPYISPDGKTLYYVSDREGGFGKMDIWYSVKLGSNLWGEPINIGNLINSPGDEVFPYLSKQNTLYFASNKPNSKGGFDIYYTSLNKEIKIQTFGTPINSEANDYSYISMDNGKSGYFSSNRKQRKDDDIYFFENIVKFENCQESVVPKSCFTFYDLEFLDNEKHIKYIWDFGDGDISHEYEPQHCFEDYGRKNIKLSLIDTITGQVTHNVSSFVLNIPKPLDYYFDIPEEPMDSVQNIKIMDFNLSQQYKEAVTWKIDDEYYFSQDTISFPSPYPGEYNLKALLSNSCLQSEIIVQPKDTTIRQFKIVPSKDPLSPLTNFVKYQLINTDQTKQHNKLTIPFAKRKETLNWAKSFVETCRIQYNIHIEVSYPLKTENNYILLKLL